MKIEKNIYYFFGIVEFIHDQSRHVLRFSFNLVSLLEHVSHRAGVGSEMVLLWVDIFHTGSDLAQSA